MGTCVSKQDSQHSRLFINSLASVEQQAGVQDPRPSFVELYGVECSPSSLHGALAAFYRTHPHTLSLKIQSATTDLSDLPIPESLQVLQLNDTCLQDFPRKIKCGRQLVRLSLTQNKIYDFSANLASLKSLQQLDLSQNCLTCLNFEAFATLKNLESLVLAFNEVTAVTGKLPKHLTELDLSFNKLAALPEEMFLDEPPALGQLFLQGNPLTSLPENIEACKALHTLDLAESGLETLPNSLAKLPNLTTLHLPVENVHTPPPEVVKLGVRAIREYFRKEQRPVVNRWKDLAGHATAEASEINLRSVNWQASHYFDLYTHPQGRHDGRNCLSGGTNLSNRRKHRLRAAMHPIVKWKRLLAMTQTIATCGRTRLTPR